MNSNSSLAEFEDHRAADGAIPIPRIGGEGAGVDQDLRELGSCEIRRIDLDLTGQFRRGPYDVLR